MHRHPDGHDPPGAEDLHVGRQFPAASTAQQRKEKRITRNAPCEKWTQAKMAFRGNKQDQNSQSLLLCSSKPTCWEIDRVNQLFVKSPNLSSFKKWWIMRRAVDPGFSTRPNQHIQK